jgi:hypothetical protein
MVQFVQKRIGIGENISGEMGSKMEIANENGFLS